MDDVPDLDEGDIEEYITHGTTFFSQTFATRGPRGPAGNPRNGYIGQGPDALFGRMASDSMDGPHIVGYRLTWMTSGQQPRDPEAQDFTYVSPYILAHPFSLLASEHVLTSSPVS
jgi:hypothetical protein